MTDAWGGAWGISFGSAWGAAAQGVPLVIPHGAVPGGGGGSPFPMNRHYTFPLRARRTRRRRDEEFFILRAAA